MTLTRLFLTGSLVISLSGCLTARTSLPSPEVAERGAKARRSVASSSAQSSIRSRDLLKEVQAQEAESIEARSIATDAELEGESQEVAATGVDPTEGAAATKEGESSGPGESVAGEGNESSAASAQLEQIPVDMNDHVQKWIKYFTEKDRERFARFLERGNTYREVVETTLRENDLPVELYYLAMIESGYHTSARSHASAVGVWQFIQGTGKRYGLEISHYVDERQDPIRATEAAAKYLKDLYNVFGSWHLAMAAYNAGEYRIVRAVLNGKSRNFWELVKKKVLPSETADYVPKFLAAVEIGQNPEKYGFKDIPTQKYPDVEAVEVPSPVRLSDVASTLGIPYDELKRVNPHLKRGFTSPRSRSYEVWVPSEHAKKAEQAATRLAALRIQGIRRAYASSSDSTRHYHVVRRGETLGSIAAKHKVSIAYLRRLNGIRGSRILVGSKLRVSANSYHAARSARGPRAKKKVVTYRVRRGDNLISIANRFGVSLTHLKRMNSLDRNQIYVGQVLRVKGGGT